jgi:uncharacterized damage-inducible protein DinB
MPRPDMNRVPAFSHKYINLVKEDDLMKAFSNYSASLFSLLDSIPADKHDYAYADGKWTVKELVQHMIDAERVFVYRALTFSRMDENKLPGFDENSWAPQSNAANRNWANMIDEFKALRKSTEYFFGSLNEKQLDASGFANNNSIYVLGLGFVSIGHAEHHAIILKERYL